MWKFLKKKIIIIIIIIIIRRRRRRRRWKRRKRKKKKAMEHEDDNYTNCDWCFQYSNQMILKGTGGLRGWRNSRDHSNYTIIENDQNTEKSPWDMRRLAVTRTPMKNHQLILMLKTQEVNNNNNNNMAYKKLGFKYSCLFTTDYLTNWINAYKKKWTNTYTLPDDQKKRWNMIVMVTRIVVGAIGPSKLQHC